MRGVRFTAGEYEFVVRALNEVECGAGSKYEKLRTAALTKLEVASMPVKRGSGVPVAVALDAFLGVLGPRLVRPPNGAAGVFAQMARRLSDLGMTREMCVEAASAAARQWRGPIKAESLIRQADTLLSGADATGDGRRGSTPNRPVEMDDL